MNDIVKTLAERGGKYGDFREQGRITQNLKRAMHDSPNWGFLPAYMREGLDMVQHKISRMLNGDAFYDDNVHDMIGYTTLMQDRMAQDRDGGAVFDTQGDKLYPQYVHEEQKPVSPKLGGDPDDGPNNWSVAGSYEQVMSMLEAIHRTRGLSTASDGPHEGASLCLEDLENLVHLASKGLRSK